MAVALTGNPTQDQGAIMQLIRDEMGPYPEVSTALPAAPFTNPSEFSSEFREKFQKSDRERRLRKRPSGSDRGVQIADILTNLGREVFRPDDLSFATYIRMLRDSEIAAAYRIIINATISRGWEINGGDETIRQWFIDMYRKLPMNATFEQVLSAFAFGSSFTEKVFQPADLPNGRVGLEIARYKVLPPWTMSIFYKPNGQVQKVRQYRGLATLGNPNNFGIFRTREGTLGDRRGSGLGPIGRNFFPRRDGNTEGNRALEDFGPEKINILTFQPQFGDRFGESGLKPAYTDWVLKESFLRFQAEYMQIMAGGAIIGKAGYAQVDEMRDELVNFSSSGVIALPEDQEVIIDRPNQTDSPFIKAIRYHDEQITKALLVPVLLMGQKTEFGSRSLGETHFELFKIVRTQKMQQDMAEWVQKDIEQLGFWNFGIDDPSKLPTFSFKAWSTVDLEQLVNFMTKSAEMGMIGYNDLRWIRDMVEMPDAETKEDLGELFPVAGEFSGQTPTIGGRPDPDLRRKRGDDPSAGSKQDGQTGAKRPKNVNRSAKKRTSGGNTSKNSILDEWLYG